MTVKEPNDSRFLLRGPAGNIEARLTRESESGTLAERRLIAVICHPHPVHGGTMDNKVVTTLVRTYRDLGIKSVSFNFRGVGGSEGGFDNGVGELDDLLAVIEWAKKAHPGDDLLLAGFSFGSSIAAQACFRVADVHHLTLVAPPVERYPYDREGGFPCPVVVVQGDRDERVHAAGVYEWVAGLKSPAELIRYEEAGHFFHGYLTILKEDLSPAIARQLA